MTVDNRKAPRKQHWWMPVLLFLSVVLFLFLGSWQVKRLAWKEALIARVEQRVAAPAVAAPAHTQWPQVSVTGDEYRHVQLRGQWVPGKEVLVYASTELGPGYWLMVPLQQADGSVVWINHGFVDEAHRPPSSRPALPAGEVQVDGLLRLPETAGLFLRANVPAEDRWYNRSVVEMSRARGLGDVAPFFVDASRAASPGPWPKGGMTRIHFNNNHLSYALTWFGMAALATLALAWFLRAHRRPPRAHDDD